MPKPQSQKSAIEQRPLFIGAMILIGTCIGGLAIATDPRGGPKLALLASALILVSTACIYVWAFRRARKRRRE